jgi:hypothetical protein
VKIGELNSTVVNPRTLVVELPNSVDANGHGRPMV